MKKTMIKIRASAAILAAAIFIAGCGEKEPEQYGSDITSKDTVSVKEILSAPESFTDKPVVIEGEIAAVCPSGCWFDLKSEGLELHVDINPSGFEIPQKQGSKAAVEGTVELTGGQVNFIGTGVRIK
jgi:PBP1b-binding outer membrane lipoprotein LpoB